MTASLRDLLCAAVVAAGLTAGCAATSGATGAGATPTPSGTAAAPPAAATTSAGRVAPPPAGARVDYQLGGAYPPAADVRVVTRDRTASPAAGRYSICYVNAFQTQPDEAATWERDHPALLLRRRGALVEDPGWPGEVLLDTSTAAERAAIAAVEGAWIDGCAAKGFQAVEPDNLDSWTRSHGLLTRADALALASALIARAHADGLAIAQKNTAELGDAGRRAGFDFAVAEECGVYDECSAYQRAYGREVIEIEYTDDGRRAFARACRARGGQVSILLRDRDVVPAGDPRYRYRTCPVTSAPAPS